MTDVYKPKSKPIREPYEYAVVRGFEVVELVAAVNNMAETGWCAVGGISFRSDGCCYQAMYRENQISD